MKWSVAKSPRVAEQCDKLVNINVATHLKLVKYLESVIKRASSHVSPNRVTSRGLLFRADKRMEVVVPLYNSSPGEEERLQEKLKSPKHIYAFISSDPRSGLYFPIGNLL
ncbi:hypothetical protein TNCV_4950641 [Trichonephila clavipes]|nr:hypothetical protein TNCV_4950641 [Trichonephila clavipes]